MTVADGTGINFLKKGSIAPSKAKTIARSLAYWSHQRLQNLEFCWGRSDGARRLRIPAFLVTLSFTFNPHDHAHLHDLHPYQLHFIPTTRVRPRSHSLLSICIIPRRMLLTHFLLVQSRGTSLPRSNIIPREKFLTCFSSYHPAGGCPFLKLYAGYVLSDIQNTPPRPELCRVAAKKKGSGINYLLHSHRSSCLPSDC